MAHMGLGRQHPFPTKKYQRREIISSGVLPLFCRQICPLIQEYYRRGRGRGIFLSCRSFGPFLSEKMKAQKSLVKNFFEQRCRNQDWPRNANFVPQRTRGKLCHGHNRCQKSRKNKEREEEDPFSSFLRTCEIQYIHIPSFIWFQLVTSGIHLQTAAIGLLSPGDKPGSLFH